jgi:hypothetical protein
MDGKQIGHRWYRAHQTFSGFGTADVLRVIRIAARRSGFRRLVYGFAQERTIQLIFLGAPTTETTSGFEQAAEFVMIDAPILDSMRPNTEAFRSYFAGEDVATFRNLGGDAILIAPSPDDASFAYPHLGAFQKIRKLWHSVGQAVCGALSDQPTWLSTSGLGIAWLHIRLDSYPKYYQHQPYKRWPLANGHDEH